MRVDQLRFEGQLSREVSDRLGEKNEPRCIVGEIDSILVIEIRAVKEFGLINEQDFQAGFRLECPDLPAHLSGTELEVEGGPGALHAGEFLPDALVKRDHEGHVMVECREAPGQGANHVRKAAGFAIRMGFAAREKNSHFLRASPFCKVAAPM
jgi:hypothetical protein